ncbi:MAG: 3-deoxy-D-manno-octulosonic acid transferase [Desulfobacula sp.]|nr:3-deoxy-D-manno-octulosonic acid transferase [Desulfobacula sp.]
MTKNAFILNFLKLYNMLWVLLLPLLKKNSRLKHGFEKQIKADHLSRADIWIQAASAGEAYLACELIKTLIPKTPIRILITTITIQGREILTANLTQNTVHNNINLKIEWFPFDIPKTIQRAVQNIQPQVMILLETEIWPALLFYLKQKKTKIAIINARLSKGSFNLYRRTRMLWKHLSPDLICATSIRDANRYRQLFGSTTIQTMSNIKFETMKTDSTDKYIHKNLTQIFPGTLPVTILASVRRQEEKELILLIKRIKEQFPNQVIALFPRHMHRVKAWEKHFSNHKLQFDLRSRISTPATHPSIILWDRFVELKSAYAHASVGFVGGSLKPLGGQNFLEPAILGSTTITGPYNDDFAWVGKEIYDQKIVIKKKNWQTVADTIIEVLKRPCDRTKRAKQAREYIQSCKGGTQKACDNINNLLVCSSNE